MAATDEDLQKLGKPPICSDKKDEWSEWSVVTESYVSLLSAHIPALLVGSEDTTSPDMSMTRISATLIEECVTAAKKVFHVLVMNGRGPVLAVITGITGMNGAMAWRAFDHEIRAEQSSESTKSHERNPECEDFSLRAHSL